MKLVYPTISFRLRRKQLERSMWYWIVKRGLQHPIHYAKYIPKALEEAYYDLPREPKVAPTKRSK